MTKIVGFVQMSKRKGAVVFVETDGGEAVHGRAVDKIFVYDDLSDKITDSSIGHEVDVAYGCGYNGKAYVSGITIK